MAVHDLDISPAQENNTGEQGTEGAGNSGNHEAPANGIEKRFGELTAKMYAAQEQAASKDAQILALTTKMTEFMTRQQELNTPAEDSNPIPEGMDPAQAAYFERMMQRIEAKYEAAITQTQAGIQRNEAAGVAQQLATRFGVKDANIANSIAQRAADLAAGWRQKGLPFAPSDAADFAFMEHLKSGGIQRASSGFAANPYAVTPGSGPVPSFAPATRQQALPSNFDSLSPDRQIAELEKRGIDDLPL